MSIGRKNGVRLVLLLGGLLLFLALPFLLTNDYLRHLAILAMLFSVVASNWDLTLGYAGLFNFAHVAFFGLGAYTSGILSVRFGISPWIGILAGICVAVIISVIVSIPAIRLRGIYVALSRCFYSTRTCKILSQQSY
jgi:branched-chain amino acid transport system permease protein